MLVFGSVNVDLVFELAALPRPGQTVLTQSYATVPGGKGANQAVAAARAGARVSFAGRIGEDGHGAMMRDALIAEGIETAALTVSTRPTGVAVIGVERSGENAIMVASGANLDARASDLDDATLAASGLVLCQNEVPMAETLGLLARARRQGVITVLNAAPVGDLVLADLQDVDILIVNEHEAAGLTRGAEPVAAAMLLAVGDRSVVVTLGGQGAIAVSSGRSTRVSALPVTVVDTTGAGDTFAGVLAASLDGGHDLGVSIRRASVAASLACERMGAQAAMPRANVIAARLSGLAAT